jgi:2-keto-3-deoxy-L-rhamnonate aldolase RhmA
MCPGWDFVWIDGQHGQLAYDSICQAVIAAENAGVATMVRAPGHEYGILGPLADLAPDAIMLPMVNSADEACNAMRALAFPPHGQRSFGGRRIVDMHGMTYHLDTELMVLAQIETPEAVSNVDDIIATPGIQCLFVGAADLRIRMGIPIATTVSQSPELQEALKTAAQAAKNAGKFAGCVAPDDETLEIALEMGYSVIALGSDVGFIRTGVGELRKRIERFGL